MRAGLEGKEEGLRGRGGEGGLGAGAGWDMGRGLRLV